MEYARGPVTMTLAANERSFGISIFQPMNPHFIVPLTHGPVPNLDAAAQVIDLRRSGGNLRDLCASFPFLVLNRIAQAWEGGNPVEVTWEMALESEDYADVWPILRAAHADDQLRLLLPSVTMRSIARFALDHTNRRAGSIVIQPAPYGEYEVVATWDGPEPWQRSRQTVATVDEAIAVAASLIP